MQIAKSGKGDLNKLYTQIKTVNPSMVFTLDILEDSVSDIINLPEFKNIRKIDLPLDFSVPGHFAEKMKIRMLRGKNDFNKKSNYR
jgi:hypothetical protein